MSRRHAAALIYLVSCRGLLEIPDDPRVEPDSREEHYRHERHGQGEPEAPDAGRAAARPPAVAPATATDVRVTPSDVPVESPPGPSAAGANADVDASVDAASDAASSMSTFTSAGSYRIALH